MSTITNETIAMFAVGTLLVIVCGRLVLESSEAKRTRMEDYRI